MMVRLVVTIFRGFFRPECDWVGIDKSLLWGRVNEGRRLSGVIYSGLNEEELKKWC